MFRASKIRRAYDREKLVAAVPGTEGAQGGDAPLSLSEEFAAVSQDLVLKRTARRWQG